MQQITSPINGDSSEDLIANLQEALLFLKTKNILNWNANVNEYFKKDKQAKVYELGTFWAVQKFQKKYGLTITGTVDEPTANKCNEVLTSLNAFTTIADNINKTEVIDTQGTNTGETNTETGVSNTGAGNINEGTTGNVINVAPDTNQVYKVSGKVFNSLGEPIAGQSVAAYDVDLRGAAIYRTVESPKALADNGGCEPLGGTTSNNDGYFEITFVNTDSAYSELALADVVVFATSQDAIIGRSALSIKTSYNGGVELKDWNVILANADHRGTTEYSMIMAIVQPLLESSQLTLDQLFNSLDQIQFLANETEQDFKKFNCLYLPLTFIPIKNRISFNIIMSCFMVPEGRTSDLTGLYYHLPNKRRFRKL